MRSTYPRAWIPEGGVKVTFHWNDVALETLLRVLKEHYPSGYTSMVDHIRDGINAKGD